MGRIRVMRDDQSPVWPYHHRVDNILTSNTGSRRSESEIKVENLVPKTKADPYSSRQWPMGEQLGSKGWNKRPRSPGLKWYKHFDSPEGLKCSRVLIIDYVKMDHSKEGTRKVAAQEITSIEGLRKLYSNPNRREQAVLRVIHVQGADWATKFLLHKFNINALDDLVGTDFGRYVKYKRPERRGGKPFLSGKSWKTTHDPWRGVSRTSFGLDYLKNYACPEPVSRGEDAGDKLMELNYYDENDNSKYGYDVFVQRLSCYIQYKESVQGTTEAQGVQNPYLDQQGKVNGHKYIPHLDQLDNGNAIILFENSQTGSISDTLIAARESWESRWRRLPFYLAYESGDVTNDDLMALECSKLVLQDIWKAVAHQWEDFLDTCNTHVSILEDKIYEQPADESRAPELWTNSSMWLKIERLVAVHRAVVKEMQLNLRELTGESEEDDDWLSAIPADMEKISELVEDDLIKPTANLSDLMYKSVGIRDSRHSLQLNLSLWRISWLTFVFLPLTFISSFFGMNVDIFNPGDPSVRYYFASAVPMMVLVLILWYLVKHVLAAERQTPYQRGVYENMFYQMALAHPQMWSRSGPRPEVNPKTPLGKLKWRLILTWNRPEKTIRAGRQDSEYDDLGAVARLKRMLTRRWTSQIRGYDNNEIGSSSTTTLEDFTSVVHGKTAGDEIVYNPPPEEQLPAGMLEVPIPQAQPQMISQIVQPRRPSSTSPRPSSKGSSSANRNSGIMVEEEGPDFLQDWRKSAPWRRRRSGEVEGVKDVTANVIRY